MRIGLVLSCLLLLATAVDAKDLVVKQRSSSGFGGGAPNDETVYITNDKIVTDSAGVRTIVDLDKQNMTSIDKTQKAYTVVTFDELRKQMDMLRQSLDSMPPDARKRPAPRRPSSSMRAPSGPRTATTSSSRPWPATTHTSRPSAPTTRPAGPWSTWPTAPPE